jgi:cytochrome c
MHSTTTIAIAAATALGAGALFSSGFTVAGQSETAAAPAKAAGEDRVATVDPANMAQWARARREPDWMAKELEKHKVEEPADNADLVGKGQGSTYGKVTPQDVATWKRETYKLAVEGSRVFHSATELGSEIAVSCDMCHPDGSNTHPETYPKFQVQLGRVALLRDMINWCIEQPVRGQPLAADDPKMRALEAYIYAQRKGEPLIYGKR